MMKTYPPQAETMYKYERAVRAAQETAPVLTDLIYNAKQSVKVNQTFCQTETHPKIVGEHEGKYGNPFVVVAPSHRSTNVAGH